MIFCVEDDPNIRELEVYTLQSVGFKALGCSAAATSFLKSLAALSLRLSCWISCFREMTVSLC